MSDTSKTFVTIDPATLPKHFDSREAEPRWDERWDELRIHHYDPSRPRDDTFVVDTPPPTVSGSLHIGHVFSYTHADVIVRQRRMLGQNIFYPMGWDDNGLPTERRVQNLYHVRCEPHVPYEPGLQMEPATAKQRKKERPRVLSRRNFIELCQKVTAEDEKVFENLFRRVGLSVDWRQQYATIDDRSRHLAQLSFLDLYEKGHIYSLEAPTMWDVDFQTAVAQAEVEDRNQPGAFHDIEFGVADSDRSFVISTTRPELLPACVGVTAHPDDTRYKDLFGKRAVTPLFFAPVPIFASELANPEKGTGILMVCTFGDATDVQWWREHKLALRQILDRDGRLRPVRFGHDGPQDGPQEGFASLDAEAANRRYDELAGKSVAAARKAIVDMLGEAQGSATGKGAPLQGTPRAIDHAVKFYEKGDRPLEFITTRQWFVRLMDRKDELLDQGEAIGWHPDFMRLRYRNWTENLQLDWCISRQRYFGVAFPVWYRLDDDGRPLHDQVLIADPKTLPVDPMSHTPPGFDEDMRDRPGGFTGEADVFDTWFTSSLTPQIGSGWLLDPDRHARLFPVDLRPQSHEIIRTWAFYTVVKALLHEGRIPWRHIAISGWILDPDRKKMSKSVGNVITPTDLLDEYSSDAVRYWAASARLGTDTAFDVKVLKVGKRLSTKLFNAGKFVLSQAAEIHPISHELDRAFLHRLRTVVEQATEAYGEFDFARALMETEQFFWSGFTDTYLELVKGRARGEVGNDDERGSAVATLRLGLDILLRLFAPVLPYITEEVWSWMFAGEKGQPSIHRAPWPSAADFTAAAPDHAGSFDMAVGCLAAINKRKSEAGVSVGRVATRLVIAANPATLSQLQPVLADVLNAARCEAHEIRENGDLEDGVFAIADAEFAEKAPKG